MMRGLHGWSKIDSLIKLFRKRILEVHEAEFIELLRSRSVDADVWLFQASEVIFKRKGAAYGLYQDVAMANCDTLINDPEKFVQTVIGWWIKDLIRWHKRETVNYPI